KSVRRTRAGTWWWGRARCWWTRRAAWWWGRDGRWAWWGCGTWWWWIPETRCWGCLATGARTSGPWCSRRSARAWASSNEARRRMNAHFFREYDIRGLVDQDLTEEVVELLGKGLGTVVRRKGGKSIVVGRDCRESSTRFRDRLVAGINSTGLDVLDV